MTEARVVPLVLAAGASSRMGSPKAELAFGERTALELILETCRAAGLARAVVVVGAHPDVAKGTAADVVVNADWAEGRTTSIRAGLAAVAGPFLLWPVDACLPGLGVVQALLAAQEKRPDGLAWVPSHDGRRGHPVLLAAEGAERLRALGPDQPAREVIRALHREGRLVHVETQDGAVLQNMNTPEDHARWLQVYESRESS